MVSGQTYSRKQDDRVVHALSSLAQSAHKIATDLRLLQHEGELEEPFEASQVGSSSMPYKRNPMRAERICSLARHVIALSLDTAMTAATQWLERTLDDSANKRIAVPEAFLAADAILTLLENVVGGLVVHPEVCARRLAEEAPFLASENVLMEAVRRGGDRQELHEKLRVHARASAERRTESGGPADLLDRIARDPAFGLSAADVRDAALPEKLIGRTVRSSGGRSCARSWTALAGAAGRRRRTRASWERDLAPGRVRAPGRALLTADCATSHPLPLTRIRQRRSPRGGRRGSVPGTAATTASRAATASGEIFDSSIGAHRDLPIGTVVDVTSVDTGARPRARQRPGPFPCGDACRLSREAALRIGLIRPGIEQCGSRHGLAGPRAATRSVRWPEGPWAVQVGSFGSASPPTTHDSVCRAALRRLRALRGLTRVKVGVPIARGRGGASRGDRAGRVQGIVVHAECGRQVSRRTENLGF